MVILFFHFFADHLAPFCVPRGSLPSSLKTPGGTNLLFKGQVCMWRGWVVLTRALDEAPLKAPVFWAEPCLQHHVLAVFGGALHGSAIRTLHALSSASVTGVPTPAAIRLLQTQTTCTQTRAVLSCNDRKKKEMRSRREKSQQILRNKQWETTKTRLKWYFQALTGHITPLTE